MLSPEFGENWHSWVTAKYNLFSNLRQPSLSALPQDEKKHRRGIASTVLKP
jgi:hypothetical protein